MKRLSILYLHRVDLSGSDVRRAAFHGSIYGVVVVRFLDDRQGALFLRPPGARQEALEVGAPAVRGARQRARHRVQSRATVSQQRHDLVMSVLLRKLDGGDAVERAERYIGAGAE